MNKILTFILFFFNVFIFSQEINDDKYQIKFIVYRVTKKEFLKIIEKEFMLNKKQLDEIEKIVLKLENDNKLEFNRVHYTSKKDIKAVHANVNRQKSILTASFAKILTYYQLKKWHKESDNWK